MIGTSGFIRGLYFFSVWLFRFISVQLLWLLFNFPLIFFILNVFVATNTDDLLVNVITICILAPFIFFPATTGMFGVIREWVIGNRDTIIFKTFWRNYKENYLRSLQGGFIFVPLIILLGIDYFYFVQTKSPLIYIFLFIAIFLFVLIMHFFSNTVHMELKLFHSLKNSFLLSVGNPTYSICIAILSALIVYISLKFFNALIVLGLGSLISFSSFYFYYRSLTKMNDS